MVDLIIDLLNHLLSKYNVLIAALEIIFTAKISMLMENDLVHIELIKVCIKQGYDNRIKLHIRFPFESAY
jgi:hypothetical protein